MASLREIRRKIKSVKSTQQITKAMKMVSAARMRRAQASIVSSRPFALKMEETVRDLTLLEKASQGGGGSTGVYRKDANGADDLHPFFKPGTGGDVGLLLVSGDKGLCGAFNANLFRETVRWLKAQEGRTVHYAAVGRKGAEFLRRLSDARLEKLTDLVNVFPKIAFVHAEIVGKALMDAFVEKGLREVVVIYNEFRSVAVQKMVRVPLLPLPLPEGEATAKLSEEFKFEPGHDELLDALLPRYVKAQIYRILLESQAAELAARMNAMDAASKNAGDLIGSMTLSMNRTRQALITREIAELVGGAEALAQ